MSDKITRLPVRPKDSSSVLTLAQPYSGCQHLRATVDEKLAELTCSDCGAKMNPIVYLAKLAKQETSWGWQGREVAKARAELAERKKCRCTKCGEWTEIRPVGDRELKRIRASEGKS